MSGLFGSKPKAPDPVRMPVADDAAAKAAAERQRLAMQTRGGRSSTILSRQSGGAGTGAYGNSLLGQAG